MGWWLLPLVVKILVILQLSVHFFPSKFAKLFSWLTFFLQLEGKACQVLGLIAWLFFPFFPLMINPIEALYEWLQLYLTFT